MLDVIFPDSPVPMSVNYIVAVLRQAGGFINR